MFFAYYFLKVYLHQFSQIKIKKKLQSKFFSFFLFVDGGSGSVQNYSPRCSVVDPDPTFQSGSYHFRVAQAYTVLKIEKKFQCTVGAVGRLVQKTFCNLWHLHIITSKRSVAISDDPDPTKPKTDPKDLDLEHCVDEFKLILQNLQKSFCGNCFIFLSVSH